MERIAQVKSAPIAHVGEDILVTNRLVVRDVGVPVRLDVVCVRRPQSRVLRAQGVPLCAVARKRRRHERGQFGRLFSLGLDARQEPRRVASRLLALGHHLREVRPQASHLGDEGGVPYAGAVGPLDVGHVVIVRNLGPGALAPVVERRLLDRAHPLVLVEFRVGRWRGAHGRHLGLVVVGRLPRAASDIHGDLVFGHVVSFAIG